MNELYFLGMDIAEETKILVNMTAITCTDGMTESELAAYKMGIENTISALKATIRENDVPVVDIVGIEIPTELSIDELENYYCDKY